MKITVVDHVTLDGVMQAPAAPDEDTRDGFAHGGWSQPYGDQVLGEFMGRRMAEGGGAGGMLFGRWTYEDLYRAWHGRTDDNPFTEVLDNMTKYVASNTLTEPLPWDNSILLNGDAADAVAGMKSQSEQDLTVLGSATLVQSLMRRRLVDEFVLTIHPLVLGAGRRLFADDGPYASFELVEAIPTTTGVLIARYRLSA
jgi:dihydrofolate reductase